MEAIKELAKTINRINSLVSDNHHGDGIGKARAIRAQRLAALNKVAIHSNHDSRYGSSEPNTLEVEAAKAIQEGLRAKFDQEGSAAQCAAINAIADEIEELHTLLPRLAGKAVIEAWAIARDFRKEANDGQN